MLGLWYRATARDRMAHLCDSGGSGHTQSQRAVSSPDGLAFSLTRSEVKNHRCGMLPPGRGARRCTGFFPERASFAIFIIMARLSLKV